MTGHKGMVDMWLLLWKKSVEALKPENVFRGRISFLTMDLRQTPLPYNVFMVTVLLQK